MSDRTSIVRIGSGTPRTTLSPPFYEQTHVARVGTLSTHATLSPPFYEQTRAIRVGLRCCFDAFDDRSISGGWGQTTALTWPTWYATDPEASHQMVDAGRAELWLYNEDLHTGTGIGSLVGRAMYAGFTPVSATGEWIFRVRFPRDSAGTADNNFTMVFGFTQAGNRYDGAFGAITYTATYGSGDGDGIPRLGTGVEDDRWGITGGHADTATWYGWFNGLDGVYAFPGWSSLNDWWTIRVYLDRYGIYFRLWRDEHETEYAHVDPSADQPGTYVTGAGRGEAWTAWQCYDDQVATDVIPDQLYVNVYSTYDNHWAEFDWMTLSGDLCDRSSWCG